MTPDMQQYVRVLSMNDRKTLSQKVLKTVEEVGELARYALPFDNAYTTTHRFVEKERLLEEVVDTVLTAISVGYALEFTDDEINAMFAQKIEKWALLQSKEQDIKYPLPFEAHVTVQIGPDSLYGIDHFKQTCREIGVKPIVLDLQDKEGAVKMVDVMTSSKHLGDNRSAYEYAHDIARKLTDAGFIVTRIKLETVPWHPAAPIGDQPMPKDCYFEAHIPVTLQPEYLHQVTALAKQLGLHPSRNVFKRNEDGTVVLMLTLRHYAGNYEQFKSELHEDVGFLTPYPGSEDVGRWTIGKLITEFSVYDTKVSHDASWIDAK